MPDVVVVLGSYNRLPLLQCCVGSLRRSVGALTYRIVIADGGSTDGSVTWMESQPDVELIHGDLSGAVRNFNLGFARAIELEAPFVAILNDDDRLLCPPPIIRESIDIMRADEAVGGVAFETNLRGPWTFEEWNGKAYVNKGVVRREALMAVSRAQGDPEGKRFWSPEWKTYAADTQAGLLIWKLGWRVERGVGLRVDDTTVPDALRKGNVQKYCADGTSDLFTARWNNPHAADYDPELALSFGGRVR